MIYIYILYYNIIYYIYYNIIYIILYYIYNIIYNYIYIYVIFNHWISDDFMILDYPMFRETRKPSNKNKQFCIVFVSLRDENINMESSRSLNSQMCPSEWISDFQELHDWTNHVINPHFCPSHWQKNVPSCVQNGPSLNNSSLDTRNNNTHPEKIEQVKSHATCLSFWL